MIRSLPDPGTAVKPGTDSFYLRRHVLDIALYPQESTFLFLMLKQLYQYGILALLSINRSAPATFKHRLWMHHLR